MNRLITNLPIKPYETTSVGMHIAPLLTFYLSKVLSSDNCFSINLLHSYEQKDEFLSTYLKDIHNDGIQMPIFIDKDNIDKINEIILKLLDKNIIKISYENILKCSCGKVDIIKNGIRNFSNGTLYEYKNGNIYCRECKSLCKEYNEKILVLEFDKNKWQDIKITPIYLKKEIEMFLQSFNESKIQISKDRNTANKINYKGKEYSIDTDFIWMNYYKLFDYDQKILVASNKQISKMFLMNYLNSVSSKDDIAFIAHPYISKKSLTRDIKDIYQSDDELIRKIYLLLSLKWKEKTCNFNENLLDYLKSLSKENLMYLYESIIKLSKSKVDNNEIDVVLNNILLYGCNLQNNMINVKKLKRQNEKI